MKVGKEIIIPGVKLGGKYFPTLGDYMGYLRARSGLSLVQVSRRLGYASDTFVLRWEQNKDKPPMAQIKKLARFYNRPNREIRTMIVKFEIIKLKQKWGLYDE